jgi:glycosyltransferase involved in cell wall biosynthesis
MHICHLTSAHDRLDSRIFEKQCRTIVESGHKATLIVADGKGNNVINGVEIIDVGRLAGRIKRMWKTTGLVYEIAVSVNADIYQLHDPELLLIGLNLKRKKKIVIFDSHEDVVGDIIVKPYLNKPFNYIIAKSFSVFEKFICKRIDGVIAATPSIESKFLSFCKNVVNINNYPILESSETTISWENKQNEVCYVGSIAANRGCLEIVKAMGFINCGTKLNLVGNFAYFGIEREIRNLPSFQNVVLHGFLNKDEVKVIYSNSIAGIVTLFPIPTYLESLPIKMFEYMAAGIPFIASDFKYWRKLLDSCECCIFVNPADAKEIANAISFFVDNRFEAEKMGNRGRKLVYEKYNWNNESRKLLNFYKLLYFK